MIAAQLVSNYSKNIHSVNLLNLLGSGCTGKTGGEVYGTTQSNLG